MNYYLIDKKSDYLIKRTNFIHMKMFKTILILLLILIFDIIFTKSYQLYKLNVLAKNRSMVLNDFYHVMN